MQHLMHFGWLGIFEGFGLTKEGKGSSHIWKLAALDGTEYSAGVS